MAEQDGVEFHTFDQCEYGADFEKKTDLMSNINQDIMIPFHTTCTHDRMWWVIPWCGEEIHSSHLPLRGRQKAIPFWEWREHMLRTQESLGDFLTRATAASPDAMNKQLAKCLKEECERASTGQKVLRGLTTSTANVSWDHSEQMEPQLRMSEPLTGCKGAEESQDNNSLRNVHRWVSPRMTYVGKQLQNLIYRWVDDHPQVQTEILESLGKQSCTSEKLQSGLQQLRLLVRDLLVRNKHSEMSDTCSVDKVDNENYKTDLRVELLQYWASCVDDPGKFVAGWILNGAPAGLSCGTEELDGVFPRVDNTCEGDYHDPVTEYATFTNYAGVEDNEEATKAIESYTEKGYLKRFDKLQDLEVFLGARHKCWKQNEAPTKVNK